MSLSFWLRDYLFIPLGGSRGTRWQTLRNVAVTMFLGGLWHGASWTFVLWGLYHGLLLVLHALFKGWGLVPRSKAAGVAVTFLAVMVGWVFFRSRTLGDAVSLLAGMAGARGVEDAAAAAAILGKLPALVLVGATALAFAAPNTWEIRYPRTRLAAVGLGLALFLCALQFAQPSPFLYFQF